MSNSLSLNKVDLTLARKDLHLMAKKKQDYTGNLENCYAVRIKGEFICPSTDIKIGHSIKNGDWCPSCDRRIKVFMW